MLFIIAAWTASAGAVDWDASRYQALLEHTPAPPATLAQAHGMLAMGRPDPHANAAPEPGDPALHKVRAEWHAATRALASGGGATASAQALAARMQSASKDQQIAMAMQYAAQVQAGARAGAGNVAGMQAGSAVGTWVQSQAPATHAALRGAEQAILKLQADNERRHGDIDALLRKAYLDCPRPPRCGDTTDCPPDPGCVAKVNARLPAAIDQHRRIAQDGLAAERTAWLQARESLQPILARTASLLASAERANAQPALLQRGYNQFLEASNTLQQLDALVGMRAAFWQGIQPRPVAPNYLAQVPAFYVFAADGAELATPPAELPRGW